jgi:hypothetical protein
LVVSMWDCDPAMKADSVSKRRGDALDSGLV